MKIDRYFLHAIMFIIGILLIVCGITICFIPMYEGYPHKKWGETIFNGILVFAIGIFLFYKGLKYIRNYI